MSLEIQPDKPGNGHKPRYVRFNFFGERDIFVGPFKKSKAGEIAKRVFGRVCRERLFKKGEEFYINIKDEQ